MAGADPDLQRKARESPAGKLRVVITMSPRAQDLDPTELGIADAQSFGGFRGMCVATVTGQQVLDLAGREEIEAIDEDREYHAID